MKLNQIVVLLLSFCSVLVTFKVEKMPSMILCSYAPYVKKVQLAKAQTHFLKAPMPTDHHQTQTISKPPNVSHEKLQNIKSNQLCLAKYQILYNSPPFAHARPLSAINPIFSTMFKPTRPLLKARRRLALTTKQAAKKGGYYKGNRTGSQGWHTIWGGYIIDLRKVRTYVPPGNFATDTKAWEHVRIYVFIVNFFWCSFC